MNEFTFTILLFFGLIVFKSLSAHLWQKLTWKGYREIITNQMFVSDVWGSFTELIFGEILKLQKMNEVNLPQVSWH